jgi:transposase-like protein
MSRNRHTPEQIIGKLREAEVALAGGHAVLEVCRTLGITEQTYYRWRKEYGSSGRTPVSGEPWPI